MDEPSVIAPRPTRRILSGLSFLIGLLTMTFVQNVIKENWIPCVGSLLGILDVAVLHWWLEREIPRSVDIISSELAHLPEGQRSGLQTYLTDK